MHADKVGAFTMQLQFAIYAYASNPWYHGDITKEGAENMLSKGGTLTANFLFVRVPARLYFGARVCKYACTRRNLFVYSARVYFWIACSQCP